MSLSLEKAAPVTASNQAVAMPDIETSQVLNPQNNKYVTESNYNAFHWFKYSLLNTFNLKGRARRKEYWTFFSFYLILLIASIVVEFYFIDIDKGATFIIIAFGLMTTFFSVTIRRLHDINRSGWWILYPMLPFIGIAALITFLREDTVLTTNKWGQPAR